MFRSCCRVFFITSRHSGGVLLYHKLVGSSVVQKVLLSFDSWSGRIIVRPSSASVGVLLCGGFSYSSYHRNAGFQYVLRLGGL